MTGRRFEFEESSLHLVGVEVEESLPAAAWLATVDGAGVTLRCGSRVESTPDGVVEGCWDGRFETFDFDRAAHVFGSGVRLRDHAVSFVAPSHLLEALYVFETPRRLVVANSLAFLLEHEGIDVPASLRLGRTLATVGLGKALYERDLFTHDGGRVWRFVDATLGLTDGRVVLTPREFRRSFEGFEDYRNYLSDVVARVFDNGRNELRHWPFDLLSAVSSGYDSPACAVVATESGCGEAVTLGRSRGGRRDSGEEVGEAIGMRIHAFDRDAACVGSPPTCVAEFIASGFGGEDLPFANFEPLLQGRILVTGFQGGSAWQRSAGPNEDSVRSDLSGNSLNEYRLRLGFTHLPMPFIGAARQGELGEISRSAEMEPWTLGTSYDRPIPRRIVEEAGVPRELFGQKDKAVSVLGFTDIGAFPEPARSDLLGYVRTHASNGQRIGQAWWQTRSFVWRALRKVLTRAGLWRRPLRLERLVLGTEWLVFEHEAPISSELALRWALERVRPRYHLRSDRSQPG